MAKHKGPEFLRFCIPIVDVLRELGCSGRPAEVTDLVIERMNISEAEQEIANKNGGSRIRNQVAWARFYMVKAGLLSSSQRGVWGLTEKGREIRMDEDLVLILFRDIHQKFTDERKSRKAAESSVREDDTDVESIETGTDYKAGVRRHRGRAGFADRSISDGPR